MQYPSITNLNNYINYSSLDESVYLEQILFNKNEKEITLTKLFALLRTWSKTVHKHFLKLCFLTLEQNINVNEYDVVTGMNLLHFTCKYGAKQIGFEKEAAQVMNVLIEKGINLTSPCLWVQMNCLHYCAFFDSPSVCRVLLKQSPVLSLLNQTCPSLNNKTPLHLACESLSPSTVKILLQAGADKQILDDQQHTAADCIPRPHTEEQQNIEYSLKMLLQNQESLQQQLKMIDSTISNLDVDNSTTTATQIQIGERVRLANNKTGTIRYFGTVPFGVNLWYGIELDEATGKHDGCVGGVRYFTCPQNKGIFVQPSSVRKLTSAPHSPERERRFRPINYPVVDTSTVSSRVDTGLRREGSVEARTIEQFQVNDRVLLSKNRLGTVKYVGPTPLGTGTWYGIELDSPDGLHDGCLSVDGQRYFQCKPQHGVFVRHSNLKKMNYHDWRTHSLTYSLDIQAKVSSRMTTSDYDTKMITSSTIDDTINNKSMTTSIQGITFNVGDKVYYNGQAAIVRFIGTTLFAEGIWIGIEFISRALGKNDGSVNGHNYFQCKSNYGLFVRPNRLSLSKNDK